MKNRNLSVKRQSVCEKTKQIPTVDDFCFIATTIPFIHFGPHTHFLASPNLSNTDEQTGAEFHIPWWAESCE